MCKDCGRLEDTLDEWSKYAEQRVQNEGCLPRMLQPETAFDAALLGHSLQIEKHPRFHLGQCKRGACCHLSPLTESQKGLFIQTI